MTNTNEEHVTCDYCGGENLAYLLSVRGGAVARCIPCLAIERGGNQFTMPFEEFVNNDKHEESVVFDDAEHWYEHREMTYETARDWYRILARIVRDKPVLRRDPDSIGTVSEHTRTFLENVMGEDAFHPPSEVADLDDEEESVSLAQTTFEDMEGPMVNPGEPAGDCPECDETMVRIGYGHSVFGAVCEQCDLLLALTRRTRRI